MNEPDLILGRKPVQHMQAGIGQAGEDVLDAMKVSGFAQRLEFPEYRIVDSLAGDFMRNRFVVRSGDIDDVAVHDAHAPFMSIDMNFHEIDRRGCAPQISRPLQNRSGLCFIFCDGEPLRQG